MKKLTLLFIAMLICCVAFCDEAWSSSGSFDGSEITADSFLLLPTDTLPYDSSLASGTPVSLAIAAVDQADSSKTVEIFSDNTGTAVEGSTTWDYTATDLPENDTYTLTETVVSSYETKSLSRSVTILPEPAIFALLAVAGALFLRKRVKSLLTISVIAALSSLGARADVVSDVKFRQMRPFSRDVVISYTMTPANNTIYDVKFYGSTDNGTTVFDLQDKGTLHLSTLNEAFCDAGVHKAVWTPDESFYGEETEAFKVKVEVTAIPSEKNYLVIDLSGGASAASYPVSYLADVPAGGWTEEYKTTKMVMRLIPAGTFIMGSPANELGRSSNENQHKVTLTKPYYVGVFETTQKQYELVMGSNPSQYTGDARPVEQVSYNMLRGASAGAGWPNSSYVGEASFFGKLRAKTALSFDLPTEAQWEYACRAETTTALNSGKDLSDAGQCDEMAEVGRYWSDKDDDGNYIAHAKVGSYLPNAWGLFDMHGNVCEWCLDWYGTYSGDATDPEGAASGTHRVLRGGSWYSRYASYCRSAYRDYYDPDYGDYILIGFRVALVQNVFSDPDNQIQKDFEFEIESGSENTLPVFEVKLYGQLAGGMEYPLEEMGKVEYDGASGIVVGKGRHKLTWTPSDAYTNLVDEVKLRVEYEDVTSQATYLVLDLPSNKMRTSTSAPNIGSDKCRTEELWLKRIEPGTFTMGSPEDELGRYDDETKHQVTLTKAYYIGVFEMTQKQFANIMGFNPSYYKSDARPVEYVSYNMIRGAVKGSRWPLNYEVDENSVLGRMRKKAGNIFDLPTEAQWEYACRAGTTTALNSGKDLSDADQCDEMAEVGRYRYNQNDGKGGYSEHTTVGSYKPNAWGLYDMHGNVCECCLDWYQYDLGSSAVTEPKGALLGDYRVLRGGSWFSRASYCRSAYRGYDGTGGDGDGGGFRIALVQSPPTTGTYMIIDLSGGTNAASYAISYLDEIPEGGWTDEYKTTKMVLRKIEAGTFTMGSPEDELGRWGDETKHQVTLTKAYYIGVFEMTQKQYELVMGSNPSENTGDARPVENVTYNMLRGASAGAGWPNSSDVDEASFFGKLRAKTALSFDLPTEAQWEYACRAGTTTALNSGKDLSDADQCDEMDEVGRYDYNQNDGKGGYTEAHTTVGSYLPNAWGLYDMHGNVGEWCLDWYRDDPGSDPITDPKGADSGTYRVSRGGSWSYGAGDCRSAGRDGSSPDDGIFGYDGDGFRVALVQ